MHRTDNAVKNRFSTLSKKRTKREVNVDDENINLSVDANTSKIISQLQANVLEPRYATARLMIRYDILNVVVRKKENKRWFS